jgi:hypothetical protein
VNPFLCVHVGVSTATSPRLAHDLRGDAIGEGASDGRVVALVAEQKRVVPHGDET